MRDFFEEYWVWFLIAAFAGLMVWSAIRLTEERAQWLDACVADGVPRYRCEERWSTAHPPAPQTNVTVHSGH
jgi:hypothetical protein